MKTKNLFIILLITFLTYSNTSQNMSKAEVYLTMSNTSALLKSDEDPASMCAGIGSLDCPFAQAKVKFIY